MSRAPLRLASLEPRRRVVVPELAHLLRLFLAIEPGLHDLPIAKDIIGPVVAVARAVVAVARRARVVEGGFERDTDARDSTRGRAHGEEAQVGDGRHVERRRARARASARGASGRGVRAARRIKLC